MLKVDTSELAEQLFVSVYESIQKLYSFIKIEEKKTNNRLIDLRCVLWEVILTMSEQRTIPPKCAHLRIDDIFNHMSLC